MGFGEGPSSGTGLDRRAGRAHSGSARASAFAASPPCAEGVFRKLGRAHAGAWVERFDRRVTEPFELFRSEFGQNSFKI